LGFFNIMFGSDSKTDYWWKYTLKETLFGKFAETGSIDVLRLGKPTARLFQRTQVITGVSFNISAVARFEESREAKFLAEDLQEIRPVIKRINVWLDPSFHRTSKKPQIISFESASIPEEELIDKKLVFEGYTGSIFFANWHTKPVVLTRYNAQTEYKSFTDAVVDLCKLDHQNLVKVYGVCPSMKCSVTENMKVEGGEVLKLYLKNNKLSWEEMIGIARGIAAGLKYLHECQPPWLHRNLNTANIFYFLDGRVKINVVKLSHESGQGIDNLSDRRGEYTEKDDMLYFGHILTFLERSKHIGAANNPPVAWAKLAHICLQEVDQRPYARTALDMLNSIVI